MKERNDYIVLFLALGAAFVFVYFIPVLLNRFLFFIFIYLFYKSDRDYIWLAFLFILIEGPGGLFRGGTRIDEMRLPLYTLSSGYSITFLQIFILTAFFKALKKKIKFNPVPFLKNKLIILLYYFIFLTIMGVFINFSIDIVAILFDVIINLTLFYSVYCLFTKESDYVNIFRMLIPFGFLTLVLQLYQLSVGHSLITYFKPEIKSYHGTFDVTGIDVRPIESTTIITFLFLFSMYFLMHKKQYFNNNVLLALNIISFFSIFITGTRSYVIMFSVFYILCLIFISLKFSNILLKYSLAGVFTILIIFSSDLFVDQLSRAFLRISTIELIAEGDITAGGTMQRYDISAPAVMKAFYEESTIIFGSGFSKTYFERANYHVGFHNLLFNAGIVGAILFAVFFGSVILNTIWINRKINTNNPYKDILKIFPIIIVSLMFVNGGTMFVGYDAPLSRIILLIFILYFLNNQISCAVKWEEKNG